MEILGIGPTELLFIILIALIILGPKDMQKAGRTIGRWLSHLVRSDGWRAFRDTSREVRNLPNRLMREANLEELDQMKNEIGQIGKEVKETVDRNLRQERFGTWGQPGVASTSRPEPSNEPGPSVASQPPPAKAENNEPKEEPEPHA